MPIKDHPSFNRPTVAQALWRYTDIAKFAEMLTSKSLWLASAEVLAADDPYEGLPGAVQFPHRMWKAIDEVPEQLRRQIIEIYDRRDGVSPQQAFRSWFMLEEQRCIMTRSGRRDYYISCWHAAQFESVAMWKIYGAPGAGVAIVTNGARLSVALSDSALDLNLGAVGYRDPDVVEFGRPNAYDAIMLKRSSFAFEQEVRLVHWHTGEFHDALANDKWNEDTMRFDDLIEDVRPVNPGVALACDVDVLIDKLVVSPFAPAWYRPMIERLRDSQGLTFPVTDSRLMAVPHVLP